MCNPIVDFGGSGVTHPSPNRAVGIINEASIKRLEEAAKRKISQLWLDAGCRVFPF